MNLKIFITVIFQVFLINLSCIGIEDHEEGFLDVETLPELRTQQYKKGSYNHIIVFSAPRTGSSLVYNVFRYLFEEDSKLRSNHCDFDLERSVLKTHIIKQIEAIKDDDTLYVIPIRDPFDSCVSNYRIGYEKFSSLQSFAERLVNRYQNYFQFSQKMEGEERKIIWLKYENFINDLDNLFDSIEDYFGFSIDPRDKEVLRHGLSRKNVEYNTKDLDTFFQYLPYSGFHGKHLGGGNYHPPQEFCYWINFYLNLNQKNL